ncbi:small s [Fusarium albosuccineum]|uniref:Small s n=1 Tax=Fusarium albosuccineum TaxID=1237068 RepID=A0A8H4L7Q7_9HYPO|nr:small s [Fusarium albosuccineum]
MEPISFGLALAGIPGVLTACIQCYQHIQFGREFESDFELTWCKLEAAELRLARWGASMGIEGPESKLSADDYSEQEAIIAYRWLNEIQRAFNSAFETSSRYGKTAKPDKLQLLDTEQQLRNGSGALQAVHSHIRGCIDQRVKPRKRDRISWAIYRKGAFQNLIETVSTLVDSLIELFPAKLEAQKQLCSNEVKDLDVDSLALLDKAVGDNDTMLQAILRLEAQQRPNFYTNIEVRDHFTGQFGDNVTSTEATRSGVYSNIRGEGQAIAHFGNNIGNYQGKTVWNLERGNKEGLGDQE